MSRFFSNKYNKLTPYTPGEQPRDMQYIKLNTNESPYPPYEAVVKAAADAASRLQLYSDPTCFALRQKLADMYGVSADEVIVHNGSDEALYFAFLAFCDSQHPAAFPDITYGFYPVFAEMTGTPYNEIPLKDDLSIDPEDYMGINKTIFIANPNAPTGIILKPSVIEEIVKSNPENIVIIDEAYIDFGGESCIPLIHKYDNILITQTFSKSRSLAGGRLGYAIGAPCLIQDLNTIRYSTNPYNLGSVTLAAGVATLENQDYYDTNCAKIIATRELSVKRLNDLGFETTQTSSNFIFAKHPKISGEELYVTLKKMGVLIRHFTLPRIADYNRITVGSPEQMEVLFEKLQEILAEK